MAHIRKTIRDAVVTAITGLTTTGGNVYAQYPFTRPQGAALFVWSESERIETSQGKLEYRQSNITIDAQYQGENVQDTIDQICLEVEAAIGADPTLSGACLDCYLTNVEMEIDGESSKQMGRARMSYQFDYAVRQGAPDTKLY